MDIVYIGAEGRCGHLGSSAKALEASVKCCDSPIDRYKITLDGLQMSIRGFIVASDCAEDITLGLKLRTLFLHTHGDLLQQGIMAVSGSSQCCDQRLEATGKFCKGRLDDTFIFVHVG
jgi:hypothetical protein